jgi:ribosome maturation factor RimP
LAENLTRQIEAGALPLLGSLGYELADLELVKEGTNWYLRFYIDRLDQAEGVDIDDCQRASEALSAWLDETDPIPQAYFLEVSSPGIERRLKTDKDFLRFAGRRVKISFYAPWEGQKSLVGVLGQTDESRLSLTPEGGGLLAIPREKIAKVHLYWDGNKEE